MKVELIENDMKKKALIISFLFLLLINIIPGSYLIFNNYRIMTGIYHSSYTTLFFLILIIITNLLHIILLHYIVKWIIIKINKKEEGVINKKYIDKLIQSLLLLVIYEGLSLLLFTGYPDLFILFFTCFTGFIIIFIFSSIAILYLIPYQVILNNGEIILVSVIYKKMIKVNEIKEIHDHGRRRNITRELYLLYDGKKYDLHWLSPDLQDKIIDRYNISVIRKEPSRKYREGMIRKRCRIRS